VTTITRGYYTRLTVPRKQLPVIQRLGLRAGVEVVLSDGVSSCRCRLMHQGRLIRINIPDPYARKWSLFKGVWLKWSLEGDKAIISYGRRGSHRLVIQVADRPSTNLWSFAV